MSTSSQPPDLYFDRRSVEWAHSLTHGLGFALSVVGTWILCTTAARSGDIARITGCGIYAATLVAVYAASTLSHLFQRPSIQRIFRILDQAFIYLLIVGSYTPLALVYLHGGLLSVLYGAMWVVAVLGFLSKTLWRHRIDSVSTVAYLVLGWMPVLSIHSAWHLLPRPALLLFVGGGFCYTAGVVFLLYDAKARYFHTVWHLFVMAGSVCHFVAVLRYVATVYPS